MPILHKVAGCGQIVRARRFFVPVSHSLYFASNGIPFASAYACAALPSAP